MTRTPKDVAIEVENLLKEAGYMLGDLSFSEVVGGRVATYDFGYGRRIEAGTIDGIEFINAEPLSHA